jgi:hypothetical protein
MRGGPRPNSGRPKGLKNKATLEKEAVENALKQRIMQSADSLFNSAKSLAIGNQFLYKIETKMEGKKAVRSKPVLVTSEIEINDYIDRLDRENRGDEVEKDDDIYYFITTKEPDITAVRELFDRALGKPLQSVKTENDITIDMSKDLKKAISKFYGKSD